MNVTLTLKRLWLALFLLWVCIPFAGAQDGVVSKHQKFGIGCAACHGDKNEISVPEKSQCIQCHATADLTKNTDKNNPHLSPHYPEGLECTVCHVQHGKSEDYCAQCHTFNFKVP